MEGFPAGPNCPESSLNPPILLYTINIKFLPEGGHFPHSGLCPHFEQHNNPLSQTLQYNRISSLFLHRTNSKVLLLPFIHYRIDSTSTSVVIYNIHFSVGHLHNTHFLVLLIRALFVRSKKSDKFLDPPPGCSSWARTSRHVSPRQRIRPHTVTEVEADHNNQCNP